VTLVTHSTELRPQIFGHFFRTPRRNCQPILMWAHLCLKACFACCPPEQLESSVSPRQPETECNHPVLPDDSLNVIERLTSFQCHLGCGPRLAVVVMAPHKYVTLLKLIVSFLLVLAISGQVSRIVTLVTHSTELRPQIFGHFFRTPRRNCQPILMWAHLCLKACFACCPPEQLESSVSPRQPETECNHPVLPDDSLNVIERLTSFQCHLGCGPRLAVVVMAPHE